MMAALIAVWQIKRRHCPPSLSPGQVLTMQLATPSPKAHKAAEGAPRKAPHPDARDFCLLPHCYANSGTDLRSFCLRWGSVGSLAQSKSTRLPFHDAYIPLTACLHPNLVRMFFLHQSRVLCKQ
jgi:hypothetical protein